MGQAGAWMDVAYLGPARREASQFQRQSLTSLLPYQPRSHSAPIWHYLPWIGGSACLNAVVELSIRGCFCHLLSGLTRCLVSLLLLVLRARSGAEGLQDNVGGWFIAPGLPVNFLFPFRPLPGSLKCYAGDGLVKDIELLSGMERRKGRGERGMSQSTDMFSILIIQKEVSSTLATKVTGA